LTSRLPYYNPPFAEFNIAQEAVIEFLDKDVNLVISFETAVGKTVLAEGCFAYHLLGEGRMAYVCPFKSLAEQKYEDWEEDKQLCSGGVVVSTSDIKTSPDECLNARLLIATNESFDAKSRSRAYATWLKSLVCVVFDEAHMLSDKRRGGALEASMVRLSEVNPGCRMVLLSASMSNAMEVAKWAKSLNGKVTKCVESSWRPTKIEMEYHEVDGRAATIRKAVELASVKGGKTVVFVHSKSVGNDIKKALRKRKVRCGFHNASLKPEIRKKLEKVFDSKLSGMDVLVSTSTLSAGVNIGG